MICQNSIPLFYTEPKFLQEREIIACTNSKIQRSNQNAIVPMWVSPSLMMNMKKVEIPI